MTVCTQAISFRDTTHERKSLLINALKILLASDSTSTIPFKDGAARRFKSVHSENDGCCLQYERYKNKSAGAQFKSEPYDQCKT